MKNLLNSLCFLVSISMINTVFTQDLPNLIYSTKITTIPYFKKNEIKKFHVKKTENKSSSSKGIKNTVTEYKLNLKVKDSTEKAYRFELTYSDFILPKELSEMDNELGKLVTNYTILFSTDEIGGSIHIENSKELKEKTESILKSIQTKFEKKAKTAEEKEVIHFTMEQLSKQFMEEANIENMFLEDILFLFSNYGMELKLNEKVDYDIEYPAITGENLKGKAYVVLKEINKNTKEAKIELTEEPLQIEMENYIKNCIKLFAGEFIKDQNPTETMKIETKSTELVFMSLETGWMRKIILTNYTTINYNNETLKQSVKTEVTML